MTTSIRLCIASMCALACARSWAVDMPSDLRGGTCVDFAKTTARAMSVKAGTSDKAEIRLSPGAWVDGTYFLSEGQPSVLAFIIKGKPKYKDEFQSIHREDAKLRLSNVYQMRVELELPSGVELADVSDGQILSSKAIEGGTHYNIAMIPDFNWTFTMQYGVSEDFNWWRRLGFLLRPTVRAGSELRGARAWMSWKGERFTNVESFGFTVMPAIPHAEHNLSRFYLGLSTGGIYLNFSSEGWDAWTSFMTSIGLNAMQPDFRTQSRRDEQLKILRRNGVELITPIPGGACPIYNGFKVGRSEGRPENERFQSCPDALEGAASRYRKLIDEGVCPSAVYERMPFFVTNTLPAMARAFSGYDGIWCNWEPFAYMGRGCFCERCRRKFISSISQEDRSKATDWPKAVLRGGPLYKQFAKFMSREHAKLMHAVAEEVKNVCGGEKCKAGFIPGVAWCEMASNWRKSDYAREVRPYDYAKGFDWISPWGPYAIYPTQEPYVYSKWRNLRTFIAARDVRAQVNTDYPDGVCPKLMAYPHGMQCQDWICYPEALEMNIDSFFFNGWEAVSVYHFPRGYDQRWLSAFARSAKKAAKYEGFVFGGRRIDDEIELALSAPYAAPNSHEGTATRGLDIKKPMLRHVAYEKDGRVIVAVFNFWEKAPAFFRLKRGGTDLGELYCGALRTKVWEIASDGVVRDFTDADVSKWKSALMPEIQRAKAADAAFEAEFGDREYTLKDLDVGAMTGKADNRAQKITFSSDGRTLTLDCRRMLVESWKDGESECITGDLGALVFAQPTFDMRNVRYQVTQTRTGKGFAVVTASCRLTEKESKALDMLEVQQTVYVYEDMKKVSFITKLFNRSTDEEPRHFEVSARILDGGLNRVSSTANGALREIGMGGIEQFNTTAIIGKDSGGKQ